MILNSFLIFIVKRTLFITIKIYLIFCKTLTKFKIKISIFWKKFNKKRSMKTIIIMNKNQKLNKYLKTL